MNKKLILTGLSAFSVLALSAAHGAATIYEGFTLPPADVLLQGNTGDTGFTSVWTNDNRYALDATSISYGSLETSGGKMALNTSGGGSHRISATVNVGASLLADNSTLWFSFLLTTYEASSDNRFLVALGTDPWSGGQGGQPGQAVGFYMDSDDAEAEFWDTNAFSGVSSTSTDLVPDTWTGGESQTQLIVGQIAWGEDGLSDDTLSLYNVGTDLVLGTAFSTATFDATQGAFDTLSMSGRNKIIADVDEIRFGATLADVTPVPEPSTTALIGLGGLALILRRRR